MGDGAENSLQETVQFAGECRCRLRARYDGVKKLSEAMSVTVEVCTTGAIPQIAMVFDLLVSFCGFPVFTKSQLLAAMTTPAAVDHQWSSFASCLAPHSRIQHDDHHWEFPWGNGVHAAHFSGLLRSSCGAACGVYKQKNCFLPHERNFDASMVVPRRNPPAALLARLR
jgi:hypothetical protein